MPASGTSPSAAEEALRTTDEKANFQRLTRLLMRGGLALLREVFDSIHPPDNLPAVLRANKRFLKNLRTTTGNKVFSYSELKCLYNPHGPETYGKSAEFDISMLYKLLRSICSLTAPVTGWDKSPDSADPSREADIVRIRYYRNKIFSHDRLMQVTDADFEKLWMDISEALLRIAAGISRKKREDWKKAIEEFFHAPLTPDAEECVDELQFWYLMDMETKHTLDQIQRKQAEMQKQIEQLHSKLDIVIVAIQQEPITSRNSALEVDGAQFPSESVETRISIPQEQPSTEGTAGQSTSTELPASQQNNTAVQNFLDYVYSSKRSLNRLKKYLKKKFGADVQGDRRGSLIITISCSSLEVLEELWKEYRTGHLNEVIQATLVTAEVLVKLNLKEVKLRTIISEEDYLSYKEFLNKSAGKGEGTVPIHQAQGSPAKELVEAKVEKPISLTKPFSHQQLANLSKALGSNWRRLGSLLGIPEQRLENISTTNKLEHNKGKKMLYEWKKTIDGAATKDLQEKLKKMGMGHLLKLDEGKPKTRQLTEVSIPTPSPGNLKTRQLKDARVPIPTPTPVQQQMEKFSKVIAPAAAVAAIAQDTVKVLGTHVHSLKTAPVPSSLLRDLAADLGTKWRELGKILGFPDTLIDYFDDVKESLSDKGNAMLGDWKRLNDDDATMEVLQEALKKIDMGHLMEKVSGATQLQSSQMVKGDYIAKSGYVLIINNYPWAIQLQRSEKDVFAQTLGFTTREDINLTTRDMLKALTETAQRDFSNNDCFFCIIRSTWTEHGICGTDDKPIDIKTITSLFGSDKCPSLNGKPKIFVLGDSNYSFPSDVSHVRRQDFIDLQLKSKRAKGLLQNLDISEKDFLVWNLLDRLRHGGIVKDWPELLSLGMPLGDVIERTSLTITREEVPISLVSTLTKNVYFKSKKKNSPSMTAY